MGGFFTTKMLSMSTEKNRIQRKLTEIESELSNKQKITSHYQNIVDNLGMQWATEDIGDFKMDLSKHSLLKEFSKEEIVTEYAKHKNKSPNSYELKVINESYDEIISEIQSILKDRIESLKNTSKITSIFGNIDPKLFQNLNYLSSLHMPREYQKYNEAYEKLTIVKSEENHIVSQKILFENEKNDLAVPISLQRGILFSFTATIFGIILPSMWQHFNLNEPSIVGLVGFLISLVVMFSYFAYEFTKENPTNKKKQKY